MKVYSKIKLEEVKKQLPQELLTSKSFMEHFEHETSSMLDNGEIDISISNAEKKVTILKPIVTIEDNFDNRSEIYCTEISLSPNNGVEIIKSWGSLHDANMYYNQFPNAKPAINISSGSSVLNVEYQYLYFDEKGVQLQHSIYGDMNYYLPITYRNQSELYANTLKLHKPSNWTTQGPSRLPNFFKDASVTNIIRNVDYPAIATRHSYNIRPTFSYNNGYNITNGKITVASIAGEYPELLRTWYPFATYENGTMVSIDEHDHEIALEKLKDICLNYESVLEYSKTKRRKPIVYEELKERLKKANEMFKKEPEEKGRTM